MHCPHWEEHTCTSCTYLEIPMPTQIRAKEKRVRQTLSALPYAQTITWLPSATSAHTGFRTKAKLVVGGTPRRPTLGILGPHKNTIDLPQCQIQHPAITQAIPALKRFIRLVKLQPYNITQRKGELKYIHLIVGTHDQLMIRFVLRSRDMVSNIRTALTELRTLIPQATVITANIHPQHAATVEGTDEIILTRLTALPLTIGGLDLFLSPGSFVQTNTDIAGQLYQQVRMWATHHLHASPTSHSDEPPKKTPAHTPRTLWDLYCGIGGFALHCAYAGIEHVTGIELSREAIQSARLAARTAGFGRTRSNFITADATQWALTQEKATYPDVLIVNPPRRGIGPELSQWINSSEIQRVIYSSCNPETLAKDLHNMPNYQVDSVRIFDMFPHTDHVETACVLSRKG
ncbi:methyltransferase domain-containing protein [Schaalia sp. lx-100]|uniref:methyltransferase domain-containing protein n=1 Tax=Schaalia sp. lx-100 TaxID=2899081 RepID=UPI001E645764|nr:methyltransferase domain-containing protein [Schaalia sp. lx-100]MCD4557650.1 methyltransferase domain-containing protein [Schaalia sp. lx-100]